jgi:type I restriction enzyme S subunit
VNDQQPMHRLGDYVRVRTGKLDANASDNSGQYPFFTCSQEPLRISSFSYDCECVLVAGNGDLNVKYYDGKFDAYQRTYIIESLDRKKLDVRYLFHLMSLYVDQLRSMSIGGVIKYIKLGYLTEAKFPIPPISEQRRIAEVLDRAEALRAKRRAALAQLDTLTQSIFLDLFGDPHRNRKEWPRRPMSGLFAAPPIFGSMIPPVTERRGWLALRVGNIQNWTLDFSDRKYVDLPTGSVERHSVKDGDLLLARAIASEEHLGKCVVANPRDEHWAFDSHLMRLRFDRQQAEPEFIRHLFMTPSGRRLFLGASRKSTVQFNINTKEISALMIPVPPFTLQREFAGRIAFVEKLKATYCASLAKLDTLFAVLQHRAFRGEL